MNIEFPCPEGLQNMKPTSNGFHCDTCNKEIVNIARTEPLVAKRQENGCVVKFSNERFTPIQTFRSFAIAAMLVFGSGLFSFVSAQVEKDLKTINTMFEVCPVLPTEIVVTVHRSKQVMAYAIVKAILPNGKEVDFEENSKGVYYLKVPDYSKGKSITVVVNRGKKTKEVIVAIEKQGGVVDLDFLFRGKSITRRYITVGCPNF